MNKYLSILFVSFSFCAYSQRASIISGTKLCFPKEEKNSNILISKSELLKIETLVSQLGEIQSYQICFNPNGIYYLKYSLGNVFSAGAKQQLAHCTNVRVVSFFQVKIRHFNDTLVTSHYYTYEITH